ncbi:MAG TPA: M6 family metalloprotease domain-containing protein [Gemmatimonadales bacterium]|jgi:M6 family metalloprotease-like protein
MGDLRTPFKVSPVGARVAFVLVCAPRVLLGQGDVAQLGRERGGQLPPVGYYEALARDSFAFQFSQDNGWIRRGRVVAAQRQQARRAMLESGAAALAAQAGALAGDVNLPVFPILFANTDSAQIVTAIPRSVLEYRLYGTHAPEPYSVYNYYQEISGERLRVLGTVLDWARVSQPDTFYEGSNNGLGGAAINQLIQEIVAAHDDTVDYGMFDNDGPDGVPNSGDDDGKVDAIVMLHPETGGECGGPNIWSHRYNYGPGGSLATDDASANGGFIKVDDYIIQGAQGGDSGCAPGEPQAPGVVTHETGHLFGLPDLYDTDYGGAGIGRWGLMGSGNYNRPNSPAHMEGWSRAELGWVTEVTVARDTIIVLPVVESADTVFVVPADGSSEYFLLENRQRVGSDQYLRESGLLIWHVDPSRIAQRRFLNEVNDALPYGMALEQADGFRSLQGLDPVNTGDAGDPYPGSSGNTVFGINSNPSSVLNDSTPTYITVDSIQQLAADGPMRARVLFTRPTYISTTDAGATFRLDGQPMTVFRDILVAGSVHTLSIDSVQVEPDGASRHTWVSWSNGGAREHQFTATSDGDTILANVEAEYRLRVTVAGSGGAVSSSPPADLAGTFLPKNATIQLTASTSQPSTHFEGWTGTVASANPVLDLTMTGPHDIQAQFVPVLNSDGADLGVGTMGAPYRDTLTAAGGIGTYQWRRLTGTLPLGLTLVPEGVVLGRPAASGAFTLVVEVTSGSQRDTATVALEIGEPVLAMAAVVNKLVGLESALTRDEEFYLDLLGNSDGTFDLGDFLAWVRSGAATVSPETLARLRALRPVP